MVCKVTGWKALVQYLFLAILASVIQFCDGTRHARTHAKASQRLPVLEHLCYLCRKTWLAWFDPNYITQLPSRRDTSTLLEHDARSYIFLPIGHHSLAKLTITVIMPLTLRSSKTISYNPDLAGRAGRCSEPKDDSALNGAKTQAKRLQEQGNSERHTRIKLSVPAAPTTPDKEQHFSQEARILRACIS